jgi:parvulin-like peptidyl-prolyl isomerase
MFGIARTGLLTMIVLGMAVVGKGQETPPPGAPAPGPGAAPAPGSPAAANANDVLATVTSRNQTTKFTRGEIVSLLRNFSIPAGEDPEFVYNRGVEILTTDALLNHFLARQNIPVPANKVEEQIDLIKENLRKQGQDLPTFLRAANTSMDELRRKTEERMRWSEYSNTRATEAELRKYLNNNRDRFSGTQVRASHILLKVDPKAGAAEKEKTKQTLIGIRNDILQGKLTFAEAANKYSNDPGNEGGAGGDLDWFPIEGTVVEEFAVPAFKLKKGDISEPVETPYGLHLIQVTDRKEGKLPDFEQYKLAIKNAFVGDLQKQIVNAERKEAKIDIKPMPKDLFGPSQPAGTTTTPAPAAGTAGAPK